MCVFSIINMDDILDILVRFLYVLCVNTHRVSDSPYLSIKINVAYICMHSLTSDTHCAFHVVSDNSQILRNLMHGIILHVSL